MKVFEKFPFVLGLMASLFMLLSFRVKSPNSEFSIELIFAGSACAVVYWCWICLSLKQQVKKGTVKKIWFLLSVCLPFIGALLYQVMQERLLKSNRIELSETSKEMTA